MTTARKGDVVALLLAIRGVMEANQQALDELDAVAADGDHGATMVMGWRNVADEVSADAPPAIGPLLKAAGGAFADVGGSIGPLWGTALLRAGQAVGDAEQLPLGLAAQAVAAAVAGVAERGRCEEGDKTLLDVLAPASRALSRASDAGETAVTSVDAARDAAASALQATSEMPATRGRARRLSERSIGHADPGAASAYLMWSTAAALLGGGSATDITLPPAGPPPRGKSPTGRRGG